MYPQKTLRFGLAGRRLGGLMDAVKDEVKLCGVREEVVGWMKKDAAPVVNLQEHWTQAHRLHAALPCTASLRGSAL